MIIVLCPHCELNVEIEEINCGIFRHGVFKANSQQINPHANKQYCDMLIEQNLIYGCGKPFTIVNNNGIVEATKCDYI